MTIIILVVLCALLHLTCMGIQKEVTERERKEREGRREEGRKKDRSG